MNNRLLRALAVAGMVLGSMSPSYGFDGVMRIDGIKGESTDQRYRDWIIVTAVGWGHQQAGGMDPRAAGRVQFQHVTVPLRAAFASPQAAKSEAITRNPEATHA